MDNENRVQRWQFMREMRIENILIGLKKVTQFFSKQAKLERYIERKSCETMDCIKDELIILPHLHYTYILVLPYVISSVSILFYSTV